MGIIMIKRLRSRFVMHRDILHLHIDSFAASVEQQMGLSLKGKSVIVGIPKGNSSGVVFSASSRAQKLGVKEGMSIRQAQRLCPDALFLPANHDLYRQVFEEILDICSNYSPLLEPDTLGSAWMDVSGCSNLFGQPHEIAVKISTELLHKLGLKLSVGCASNKLLAKIASGLGRKFMRVIAGYEKEFLSPLPITSLDVVGGRIEKRLSDLNISTIGQLANISDAVLVRQFGPIGNVIKRQVMGLDSSQVKAAYPPDTIYSEHTCDSPLIEPDEIELCLKQIISEALIKLGKQKSLIGEITLTLFDESDKGICRAIPASYNFKEPTCAISLIMQSLGKLVSSKLKPGMQISRIRVVFSDLSYGDSRQLSLMEMEDVQNRERLNKAVEQLRNRFGDDSVCFAESLMPTNRGHFQGYK